MANHITLTKDHTYVFEIARTFNFLESPVRDTTGVGLRDLSYRSGNHSG
jgi:hypothetical protein